MQWLMRGLMIEMEAVITMELYKLGIRYNGQWLYIMYNTWDSMMDDINGRFRDCEKISIAKVTKVGKVGRA